MKYLVFFLLVLAMPATTWAQPVPSDCEAPDSIAMLYEYDAQLLAARRMQDDPAYLTTLEVEADLVEVYLGQLLAVYNAANFPAGDSVTKCLPLHVFPLADLHSFLLGLDPQSEWVQNLEAGIIPTGYSAFDSLFTLLELEVSNTVDLGNSVLAVLETEKVLHLQGVIQAFSGLDGLNYVEPNYIFGDGGNITTDPGVGYTDLIYEYGWGDCPSGCIFAHFWQIRVYEDCSVEFISSWGDPVDFPCESIIDGTSERWTSQEISVFPTITNDFIRLDFKNRIPKQLSYRIFGTSGMEWQAEKIIDGTSPEIQVAELPSGLYFLRLIVDHQQIVKKFFKS